MADLLASQSAIKSAVVSGTNQKQTLAWSRYSPLESKTMNSSNNSTMPNDTVSLEHLPTQSDRIGSILQNLIQTNPNTASPPLNAWHRPTDWLVDPTQHSTPMENLHFFYNANSEATPTQTDQLNNRQQ